MEKNVQLVINRSREFEVLKPALERYRADLQMTIDRFGNRRYLTHGFEREIEQVNELLNKLDSVVGDDAWYIKPEGTPTGVEA